MTVAGKFRIEKLQGDDGEMEEYPLPGAQAAWDNVMELSLPLAQLGSPAEASHWVSGQWTGVDFF